MTLIYDLKKIKAHVTHMRNIHTAAHLVHLAIWSYRQSHQLMILAKSSELIGSEILSSLKILQKSQYPTEANHSDFCSSMKMNSVVVPPTFHMKNSIIN